MHTRELLFKSIADKYFKTGLGVEVGVQSGIFSLTILSLWPGKLYMVDAWREYSADEYRDIANVKYNKHLDNFAHAFMNAAQYRERAVIIREESVPAADLFKDKSLDFVYIDAAHDKENVLKDIRAWLPKIREGGVILGDDYLSGTYYDSEFGVIEAVKECFTDFETNEEYAKGIPQWWKVV